MCGGGVGEGYLIAGVCEGVGREVDDGGGWRIGNWTSKVLGTKGLNCPGISCCVVEFHVVIRTKTIDHTAVWSVSDSPDL